jgi:hypothetical protein
MTRKHIAAGLAVVITFPVSLAAGFSLADPFYMRFIFVGARRDFAPGDAFGVAFLGIAFSAVFFVAAMFGWWRLFRAISN